MCQQVVGDETLGVLYVVRPGMTASPRAHLADDA